MTGSAVTLLPDFWRLHARWRADHVAVIDGERRISWRELGKRVDAVTAKLRALSLGQGDRVALIMNNGVDMVSTIMGVAAGGFVVVPLSTLLTPSAIAGMVADSGACAVIVSPEHEALANDIPGEVLRLTMDADATIADGAAASESPVVDLTPDDTFAILYSSGTTGSPKGIVQSHVNRLQLAYAMALELGVNDSSIMLATTPLYSNGTWLMMLPALLAGATLVIMDRFTPERFLALVQTEAVTHSFVVPAQIAAILDHEGPLEADLSSLTALLSAGATFPPTLKQAALERLTPRLYELYGCTEGVGTLIKPDRFAAKLRSVGRPIIGNEIAIVDDAGNRLPAGQTGEIVGRGSGLTSGYHNRPKATEAAIWRGPGGLAWHRTGDLGALGVGGDLTVLGRKKDMIVSGGLNVYPADIEEVLASHPDVLEAAVIGVPHSRWGETPFAFVVTRDRSADGPALVEWANRRLSKHQRLSGVESRTSLPRNALGKIVKSGLRNASAVPDK